MSTLKIDREEKTYRAYVTDALKILTENTVNHIVVVGKRVETIEHGTKLNARWIDIIHPPEPVPEDTRTTQEIVAQVWSGFTGRKRKEAKPGESV